VYIQHTIYYNIFSKKQEKLMNIINSELKVVASENLDLTEELNNVDSNKTLEEIFNEKEEKDR